MKTILLFVLAGGMILSPCVVMAADNDDAGHWRMVLSRFSHDGRVGYKDLKANDQELQAAARDVEGQRLAEVEALDPKAKMTFWINAYNIGVFKTVIGQYPLKRHFSLSAVAFPANSIQQIPDVWNRPVLHIDGHDFTLNAIENKILRPQFKDPRVHFSIVCASIGCPVIRSEPYTAVKLDEQLADQISRFLGDPAKLHYDREHNVLYLSPIFKWFDDDFKASGGVIAFIKKYAKSGAVDGLTDQTPVQWLGYDWSLNEKR